MQTAWGYTAVANVRLRELRTRIALAVFIGATAYALSPSAVPAVWFLAVCAGQAVDWLAFRPIRRRPDVAPSPRVKTACVISAALNTTIYSAISVELWLTGGEAGRIFALVLVSGALLHVTLHMHHARAVLLAACIPHLAYFLGLPILDAVDASATNLTGTVVVFIGSILYLSHLIVAVRQAHATTAALRAANDAARSERERAEQASAAKSAFLATVSHEIRTPLNAVISAAHLMKRTSLSPEQEEHVAMLLNGGDVLLGIVNDVLDISKIEAGRMTLEEADLNLPEKLDALFRLWEPRARDKGLDLVLEGLERLPRRVRTDPLRLQQIIFNLLSNAVKFTDAGSITVRAGVCDDGRRFWLEVADTGCGIPEALVERVFDSFEQADSGTTRRYGGTGLGLAISRRLAELMNGTLSVRTKVGEGSTFRLETPIVEAAAAARSDETHAEQPSRAGEALSILLAEDHEVNRRIVCMLLEPLGWRITLAHDGGEAVAAADQVRFDAILMDMQMPVLNGLDAAKAIRAGGLNAATPIIALSANALDHHRAAWMQIGVTGFVSKPIDPAALTAAVLAATSARARAAA